MANLPELYEAAVEILRYTGAIKECPEHSYVYVDQGDDDAVSHAYAIGANKVKNGDVRATFDEMKAAIRSAYRDAPWNCPECEREKHEDD
jgi:hypothetical protein